MTKSTKKKEPAPKVGKRITAAERTKRGEPRTGAGGPRPDAERIAHVARLVTLQYEDHEIVRQVARPRVDGGFGVSDRTVRSDLSRVYADMAEARKGAREKRVDAARATAQSMFRHCNANGDRKTAAVYFDKICRIDGAYAPDAMKLITLDLADIAKLGDADLDAEIAAELVQLAGGMTPEKRAALLAQLAKEET